MWEGQERKIIYTTLSRREVHMIKDFIIEIDPNAFVTVIDANEILGYGFKSLEKVD